MQYDEAETLRKEWHAKPCKHEQVQKEYHLGSHTGDYVCATCGQEFSSRQEAEQAYQRMLEATQGGSASPVRPKVPESQR